MVDRVRIAIEVFVEAERYALAARVLIHADEAPSGGVVVPRAQVVEAGYVVVCLARVAVFGFPRARAVLVAEGVVVQRLYDVARRIRHQPCAALRIRVDVARLAILGFRNQQPHTVWRVRVACRLPCTAIRPRALGDDFRVGARRVKYPPAFPSCCCRALRCG